MLGTFAPGQTTKTIPVAVVGDFNGWDRGANKMQPIGSSGVYTAADDMKTYLSSTGPLIACFSVYEDFYSYKSGVYSWNGKAPLEGGHCVCVIGYDETLAHLFDRILLAADLVDDRVHAWFNWSR